MFKIFYILLFIIVLESCSSNSVNKNNIIDEDKFIEILKDFHKADGIISTARLNIGKHKKDTISLYNYILKKNNVSREEFDKTLKYYTNNTVEYITFYDSINKYFLKQKEKLEEKLKKESPKESFALKNLWTKKTTWELKGIPKNNPLKFNIKTSYNGEYFIYLKINTTPYLEQIDKRMVLVVNYDDKTSDSAKLANKVKKGHIQEIRKNIKTNKNKKVKSISGYVISYISDTDDINYSIKKIKIKYKYN